MGLDDLVYGLYERRLAHDLSQGDIPRHVGVILDGNRRWATEQGRAVPPATGSVAARIAEFLEWCDEVGVEVVTLWLLSTDNLNRPRGAGPAPGRSSRVRSSSWPPPASG